MSYKSYKTDYDMQRATLTVEVPQSEWTDCQKDKAYYIRNELKSALLAANAGWNGLDFKVMRYESTPDKYGEEYLVLSENGSNRWICVSGNSRIACAEALFKNIW